MVEVQSASSFHKLVYSQVITMNTLQEDTQIRRVCVYDMDRGIHLTADYFLFLRREVSPSIGPASIYFCCSS